MYQIERHHWWYLGMEAITRAVLGRWYHPGTDLRILDAGCGTGAAMTTYLAEYGSVTGFDISGIALSYCRLRKAQSLARASVTHLPFASQSFDLVTCFDVLYEHAVSSDAAALKEFARLLARGGRLLLRLPAYDWLRGQHDEVVHTVRRYTVKRIANLLIKRSGLIVEHLSYANTFLFPFILVKRVAEHIWPPRVAHSDLTFRLGLFNSILRVVLKSEAPLVASTGLPFGLSVFAVGRRP
jgi:ubiquinone/menaquinone biosynthesis C-methylase UbiE